MLFSKKLFAFLKKTKKRQKNIPHTAGYFSKKEIGKRRKIMKMKCKYIIGDIYEFQTVIL